MADDTPKTGLRGVDAGQSGANVLYNESMNRIDSLVLNIINARLDTPPGSPAEGETYVIGTSPTGVWIGHDNEIATYFSGWLYTTPLEGVTVYNQGTNLLNIFNGSTWDLVSAITILTDSSGGSANDTIAVITDVNNAGSADLAPTQDAIADLAAKVNEILTELKKRGSA